MESDSFMIVIVSAILGSFVTGVFSTVLIVAALKVHITYIGETMRRHERLINRAHERIDEIKQLVRS